MAKSEPTPPALQPVMRSILDSIISSGNEIGELQKDRLVERRKRWLLGLVIYEDIWCLVGRNHLSHSTTEQCGILLDIRRTDLASQTNDSVSPLGDS